MSFPYIEDQEFRGENFSENGISPGEYDNCTFLNCTFTGCNLSSLSFSECTFENCDLSNAQLKGTSLRDVHFKNSKLLGLRYDECDPFLISFQFENCLMNFSSFFQLKLKKTFFNNCKLEQVDFSEADFSGAKFQKCDFSGAIFSNTNLEGTDLTTAVNFSIDPEKNRIKKAKFSSENIHGLLDKYGIVIK